jgi:hypothetical protein
LEATQLLSSLRTAISETITSGFRQFAHNRSFTLGGQSYPYFYHPYNSTWMSERGVELSVVLRFLDGRKDFLEIGNVLNHYVKIAHDVVDKYEPAPGVIECDVVDYSPPRRYETIVAISTIEHVGWDPPEVKDPEKPLRAVAHLKTLLEPRAGRLFVSMPTGQNPNVDRFLESNAFGFDEIRCMRRHACIGWEEVPLEVAVRIPWGITWQSPRRYANALAFCTFRQR